MKIRAICYFITAASVEEVRAQVESAKAFFRCALERLAVLGLPVQMVRFATNSFEEYVAADAGADEILSMLRSLDALCGEVGEALGGVACIMSVGDTRRHVKLLPEIMLQTQSLFLNMPLGPPQGGSLDPLLNEGPLSGSPDMEQALRYAEAVLGLARAGGDGDGLIEHGPLAGMPLCFKCTVTACLEPGTAFFPGAKALSLAASAAAAGAAWPTPAFAIATENSDLVASAFARVEVGGTLDAAREELRRVMAQALAPLESFAQQLKVDHPGVGYVGIDPSIATAAAPEHSVVTTWSHLLGRITRSNGEHLAFGGAGTLAVSAAVTAALKSLDGITTCGYAGLMLPQTEDDGLARFASRGELSLPSLLLNSAVCGTGLDTVLVPGHTEPAELALLYADVATLAHRLRKPLACRVWPVHGKRAGDLVRFRCSFFVDSAVLPIRPADGVRAAAELKKRPAAACPWAAKQGGRPKARTLKRPAAK